MNGDFGRRGRSFSLRGIMVYVWHCDGGYRHSAVENCGLQLLLHARVESGNHPS